MVKDSVKFLVDTMVKRTRLQVEEEGGAEEETIRVSGGQIPRNRDDVSGTGICLC